MVGSQAKLVTAPDVAASALITKHSLIPCRVAPYRVTCCLPLESCHANHIKR